MPTITEQDGIVLVGFPDGITVDLAVEQKVYRLRRSLFEQHGRVPQRVLYHGEIGELNMAAAKYSCSQVFAEITEAKVIVIRNSINFTRAAMMNGLHKPDFPVQVTDCMESGLQWLRERRWTDTPS